MQLIEQHTADETDQKGAAQARIHFQNVKEFVRVRREADARFAEIE